MPTEVPPGAVARLQQLRALYVAESDRDARARLEHDPPRASAPFANAAAARLRELRALCELTRYLHGLRR